jgi:glycosyltransferase involved in cell wall biosynthesis
VERLAGIPQTTVLAHRRLQWVKHDPRNVLQRLGDITALLLGMPGKVGRVYRMIRHHDIQLVHTNSMVSLEGALAARLAGVPHVWHIRELFMEKSPKLHPVLGRALSGVLIQKLSQRIFCISQAVRAQFGPRAAHDDRLRLLYNALPPPNDEPASPSPLEDTEKPPGFCIGYIGRLSEGKRFHDLLEAVHQLIQTGEPEGGVTVLVAGHFVDAPFEARVQAQLQAYGLEAVVRFLGFQQDLRPVYAAMDVLVVPSLNEPFGRVVIEGMRAGVPCIAANSGGIPEIVTHQETGLLYPPTDTQALAETLRLALTHPELLVRLRENAGRMVRERFTIEEQLAQVMACYRELVEELNS